MGLFSTSNGFHRQERAGSLSLAEEVSKSQGIRVRILTPFDDKIRQIEQDLKNERGFEIRDIEEGLNKSLYLNSRQEVFTSSRVQRDAKESSLEAIGPATYSNGEAMVNTYASFFESLWKQSELYKKVKIHDRLENEFISWLPTN